MVSGNNGRNVLVVAAVILLDRDERLNMKTTGSELFILNSIVTYICVLVS